MKNADRVLVFRNGSIGNTLAAFPALKQLALSFPDSRLSLVVDTVGKELVKNAPFAHEVIVYDRHGRDTGALGFLRIARHAHRFAPDSAILFKRFFRNGLLAKLSGASQRYGFSTAGSAPFLTATIPYDESVHVAALNMRLVEFLGATVNDDLCPELYLTESEQQNARRSITKCGIEFNYAVAHFGGITSGAEHVSMELRKRVVKFATKELPVVLIGSGPRETSDARALIAECKSVFDMTNEPLRTTMSMIAGASRFIGTNSGPMHIAAACRVPGVVFFKRDQRFAIESIKWRPLFDGLKIVAIAPADSIDMAFESFCAAWPRS